MDGDVVGGAVLSVDLEGRRVSPCEEMHLWAPVDDSDSSETQ